MIQLTIESPTRYRLPNGKWSRGLLWRDIGPAAHDGYEAITLTEYIATIDGDDMLLTFHIEQWRHRQIGGQHHVYFQPCAHRVFFLGGGVVGPVIP